MANAAVSPENPTYHDMEASASVAQPHLARQGTTLWRIARTKARGVVYLAGGALSPSETADEETLPKLLTHSRTPSAFIAETLRIPGASPRQHSLASSLDVPVRQLSVPLLLGEPSANEADPGEVRKHGGNSIAHPVSGFFAPWHDLKHVGHAIITSYMSILLLAVPFGIGGGVMGWNPSLVFALNFTALIPLALMLGGATEDLALRFGDTIGAILNASFGNAVELILSLAALNKGLYTVVATSLIGSILSNLLLVLGCCFLFGGLNFREQSFNPTANKASCSLLFLAAIAISMPTAGVAMFGSRISEAAVLDISHGTCVLLVIVYLAYLFFQLKSHAELFAGEESEEVPTMSMMGAIFMLASITILVAFHSEFLSGAIESVSETSGLSQEFLGLIVLPIAGNAAEHITAVFVAVKNKMDLSLGVALGSSIQIAIFVLPMVVLVGWLPFVNRPMSLSFSPFGVFVLTLAVIHAYFVSSDGRSNWLMGLQLVGTYLLIALVYYFVQ